MEGYCSRPFNPFNLPMWPLKRKDKPWKCQWIIINFIRQQFEIKLWSRCPFLLKQIIPASNNDMKLKFYKP